MEQIDKSLDELFAHEKAGGRGRGGGGRGRGRGAKRGGDGAPGSFGDTPNKRRRREGTRENQQDYNVVDQTNYVYINSESEVKKVAGTVAYSLRRGSGVPTLVCTGQTAINQAVKSLTICRSYLKDDGLDFKVYPEFQPNRDRNDSIYLIVSPSTVPTTLTDSGAEVLTSSQKAKAKKIGGKIAHTIRKGKRVIVQAVGPGAVWRFVQSLLLAKNFVRTDNGLDLSFRSQFVMLKRQRGENDDTEETSEVNALQFHVFAEQI